jgi:hypothetical protein
VGGGERDARLQGIFNIDFKFLINNSLGKECLSMVPKRRPLWKQTPISRALLSISFGVTTKGASLHAPSHSSLRQRCPNSRALLHSSLKVPGVQAPFIHLSKYPLYKPPSFISQSTRYTSPLHSSLKVPGIQENGRAECRARV